MRLAVLACVVLACTHRTEPVAPPPPHETVRAPVAPPADAQTKVGLTLSVTPPDAEVVIDGISYGVASGLDPVIVLKPGLYTLLVARAGYASYRAEFSVSGKTESFVVRLELVKP